MPHYCDSIELEEWWGGWLATSIHIVEEYEDNRGKKRQRIKFISYGDERNWKKISEMLYSICCGIAKKFHPKSDEEYYHLANEAYVVLMTKIKDGKVKFIPRCEGGSPLFNLITTTVSRILCTYMNKQKRSKQHHAKFVVKEVSEKAPELLSSVRTLYEY